MNYGTGDIWLSDWTTATTAATTNIWVTGWGEASPGKESNKPKKAAAPPAPETALQWLDRRVQEMRVAL